MQAFVWTIARQVCGAQHRLTREVRRCSSSALRCFSQLVSANKAGPPHANAALELYRFFIAQIQQIVSEVRLAVAVM